MIRILDERFYPLWMKIVPLVPVANLVAHDILEEVDKERKKLREKLFNLMHQIEIWP